jgi:short-subunit dehydrogenase
MTYPENYNEAIQIMRIIITGAASGIGLATAHLLHSKGETLILWDYNESLKEQAALMKVDYAIVDVRDADAVKAAMQAAGNIDAVIHCAGIAHVGLFEEIPIEQQQQTVIVNLIGSLNVAHAAIHPLKQSKGSLILLASSSSYFGPPEFASYGATKAAIVRFAEAIRLEWEVYGIHVGVVSPHFVTTPMLNESRKSAMFDGANFSDSPDEIAVEIERMLRTKKAFVVPNAMNKLNYFLSRHIPELGHTVVRFIWQQGKKRRKA